MRTIRRMTAPKSSTRSRFSTLSMTCSNWQFTQRTKDKNKLYALHAPEVEFKATIKRRSAIEPATGHMKDGWAPGPQPAQGATGRCHPRRDVRRGAQPAPDIQGRLFICFYPHGKRDAHAARRLYPAPA
ncbi:hypothetical protein ALDI51_32450 [Alicycliphilus denitrificans]|nr:hypothetical protein ALDI51_32450 [Alicycliphilus denitrificans]